MFLLNKILGDSDKRFLNKLKSELDKINSFEKELNGIGNLEIKTKEFKKRLSERNSLDDLLPEAFAAVREAARRTLNQRHFDVQFWVE